MQRLEIIHRDGLSACLVMFLGTFHPASQVRQLMHLQTKPLALGTQAGAEGLVVVEVDAAHPLFTKSPPLAWICLSSAFCPSSSK